MSTWVWKCSWLPWVSHHSSWPEAWNILEQTPGRGSQGWSVWPESAQGDVSRPDFTNPEPRALGGETKSVHTCQSLKGFTSLHFQLLVFYLGKIPFDSPGGELLIPVSGSFFTSIPRRTDFNAWWIQTKLFPFLWLCKSLWGVCMCAQGRRDGACFRYTPVSLLSKGDLFHFFIKASLADGSSHAVLLALGSQGDLENICCPKGYRMQCSRSVFLHQVGVQIMWPYCASRNSTGLGGTAVGKLPYSPALPGSETTPQAEGWG